MSLGRSLWAKHFDQDRSERALERMLDFSVRRITRRTPKLLANFFFHRLGNVGVFEKVFDEERAARPRVFGIFDQVTPLFTPSHLGTLLGLNFDPGRAPIRSQDQPTWRRTRRIADRRERADRLTNYTAERIGAQAGVVVRLILMLSMV
jgi:hypothetical protein